MDFLQQINLERFLLFTLVLTRVSGLTMTAPIYGTKQVPLQVRALFAVALAMLIAPTQWDVAIAHPGNTLNYLVLIGSELVIGVCLGLGTVILFSGVQLAGQMIGRISGLMLADVFDPNLETSVPTFSQLMFLVTLAVFVCIGGHRLVMGAMLDTFQAFPPGYAAFPESLGEALVNLVSESFRLGIRAGVPVVTALLLSTLVMGLISRTLPQLNILMVGFGMNSMLTFATLSLTLGAAVWVFQRELVPTLDTLVHALNPRPGT
jgi:flagellar biosynthetic protein FliR